MYSNSIRRVLATKLFNGFIIIVSVVDSPPGPLGSDPPPPGDACGIGIGITCPFLPSDTVLAVVLPCVVDEIHVPPYPLKSGIAPG